MNAGIFQTIMIINNPVLTTAAARPGSLPQKYAITSNFDKAYYIYPYRGMNINNKFRNMVY